jgi:protein-L-isoaspartate(D-aspartate) O-methyltransferase
VFCSRENNRYKSLEAIKKIPRHLFLNSSFEDYAYQDKAFPIGAGQTISQPYTVAFQSQLLEIKEHKVLEMELDQDIKRLYCALGAKFTVSSAKMNYLSKPRLYYLN